MYLLLVVALLAGVVMPGRGDGDWNDDDLPFSYSTANVSGDLVSDSNLPIRIVDPDTGALVLSSATSGDEVGFGPGLTRGVQTNVKNGDFALGPPDPSQPISDSNALPYWTWEPDDPSRQSLSHVADAAYGSGYKLTFTNVGAGATGDSFLTQWVELPASQGQQYRVLLSFFGAFFGYFELRHQFYQIDKTTAIGSEVTTTNVSTVETKRDAGLVPTAAAWLRLRVVYTPGVGADAGTSIGEVRAAFLPAEATLGLGSLSASTGIINSETQVKGITIPANTLVVGSVYKIEGYATVSASAANAMTIRIRLGPTSLSGTVLVDLVPNSTSTASNDAFHVEALVTVQSVGATGAVTAGMKLTAGPTEPFANVIRIDQLTSGVTIDTTVANILELTAETAAGTTDINFRQAVISCLMAS